eukprot:2256003-Alexandrium_andersonii.AAC.1
MEPLARQCCKTTKCESRVAWQTVAQKVLKARRSTREAYPLTHLLPVMVRWCAMRASTSGIECTFSRVQSAISDKQKGSSERYFEALA